MKDRRISLFLLMTILVVVLHNAMPHHHHEDILMHNHEAYLDDHDPDSDADHHATACLIKEISYNLPRNTESENEEISSDPKLFCALIIDAVAFRNLNDGGIYLISSPGPGLNDAFRHSLTPRAPPC